MDLVTDAKKHNRILQCGFIYSTSFTDNLEQNRALSRVKRKKEK